MQVCDWTEVLTTDGLLGKVLDVHVCVLSQLLQHWLYFCLKSTWRQRRMRGIITQIVLAFSALAYFCYSRETLTKTTYLSSRIGPIFWRDLATLKRTLATWSLDILRTTGSMCLVVISWPHTSDKAWDTRYERPLVMKETIFTVADKLYILEKENRFSPKLFKNVFL